jgi:hypothetical protein
MSDRLRSISANPTLRNFAQGARQGAAPKPSRISSRHVQPRKIVSKKPTAVKL